MKSIITCDMEGVIQSMNHGAELIFGYNKNELIGKRRVSLFSPGEIVLQNVANWLSIASKDGVILMEKLFSLIRKEIKSMLKLVSLQLILKVQINFKQDIVV